MFDWRCFARLDSCIKHVGRAYAYHACSVASLCPLIPRLFLRTPLVEYFKNGERGKSFLDVAEIEEIETDEMPSRKRKQRTGKEMKWQRKASFDTPLYLEIIVMSNSHHFAETWSIFDHHLLFDIIGVCFLFPVLLIQPLASLVYFLFFHPSSNISRRIIVAILFNLSLWMTTCEVCWNLAGEWGTVDNFCPIVLCLSRLIVWCLIAKHFLFG